MACFDVNICYFLLVILVAFSTVPQVIVSAEEDLNFSSSTDSSFESTTFSFNNTEENEEITTNEQQELLENRIKNLTEQVENLERINNRLAEETKVLREKLTSEQNAEKNSTFVEVRNSEKNTTVAEEQNSEQNTNTTLVKEENYNSTRSPLEVFSVFACEYRDLSISCARGIIHILRALYGRISEDVCSKESTFVKTDFPAKLLKTNCTGKPTTDLLNVQTICESQVACNVSATNTVFGDPCGWTFKYLEVDYTCLNE